MNKCCSHENKCNIQEGDCNSDSDCMDGLICGAYNCHKSRDLWWDSGDDCCQKPSNDSGNILDQSMNTFEALRFSESFLNGSNVKYFLAWSLYANRRQCQWQGIDKMKVKNSWTVDECARQCKGVSSLFKLGTNDYAENDNQKQCFDDGCRCECEIFASATGTCELRGPNSFRLYKYIAKGF